MGSSPIAIFAAKISISRREKAGEEHRASLEAGVSTGHTNVQTTEHVSSTMHAEFRVRARFSRVHAKDGGTRAFLEAKEKDRPRNCDAWERRRARLACRRWDGRPKRALSAARSRATTKDAFPGHFELETAVLLASCAFESYESPSGGLDDFDGYDNHVQYASPFVTKFFQGVLQVRVIRAWNLPKADVIGTSDPYVMCRIGMGARITSTKKNTLEPEWNEMCRLFVEDAEQQVLRLSVFDEDRFKSDDCLGEAQIALKNLIPPEGEAPAPRTYELELQNFGRGYGKGNLAVEIAFFPFDSTAEYSSLPKLLEDLGTGQGPIHELMSTFRRNIVDRWKIDKAQEEWESKLWKFPPEGNWTLLATLAALSGSHTPLDYEKVAYINNTRTDTQVTIWRKTNANVIVIAFRGTEMTKLRDLATDASLLPCSLSVERVSSSGPLKTLLDEPAVHTGFLEAFDSVRAKLMHMVDTIMKHPAKEEKGSDWKVYTTGHSLGGALATLMAAALAERNRREMTNMTLSMYNFGSPRVGNEKFVYEYNRWVSDSFRLVNEADAVPRVPLLLGYKHVDHPVYVTESGELVDPDGIQYTSTLPSPWLETVAKTGYGEAEDIVEALAVLSNSSALAAHMEDYYFNSLQKILDARMQL